MTTTRRTFLTTALATTAAAGLPWRTALAAEELKLHSFVPPTHIIWAKVLTPWSAEVAQRSSGWIAGDHPGVRSKFRYGAGCRGLRAERRAGTCRRAGSGGVLRGTGGGGQLRPPQSHASSVFSIRIGNYDSFRSHCHDSNAGACLA